MNKICMACGTSFDCRVDEISACHCHQIILEVEAKRWIQQVSNDCLCAACLHSFNQKSMDINQKIKKSTTHLFKAVFPNTTNHYDTLFGGTALQLMDEVAFICATRFSRKRMVTVSSDRVDFKHPIPAGTLAELIATVVHVGNSSLKIKVDIFVEEMYEEKRQKAITGQFTFVAIDKDKQPISVL